MLNTLPEKAIAVAQKPRKDLLPVLIVLFLASYGLMTLLVVEQGRTIDNQRSLINQLFTDSVQLTAMKSKAIQQQHRASSPQAKAHSQVQAPSSQTRTPSAQAKTPSSQVTPRDNALSNKGKLQKKRLPERPPKVTSDNTDERRAASWI